MEPYQIRMFAEIGCDFALWGDIGEELLGGSAELLEHRLPISEDLRDRILSWPRQHYRYDAGERKVDMDDFDERGALVSRELQRELGPRYAVEYLFVFAGSRERLLPQFADDPCPGWGAR
ncbi:MAG: hypothetical protein ABI873_07350 [Marmoricola sp.]